MTFGGGLTFNTDTTNTDTTLTSGGGITFNDAVNGGANTLSLASGGTITQSASGAITAGTLNVMNTAQNTDLSAANNTINNLGAITALGGFSFKNNCALTISGAIDVGGNSAFIRTTPGNDLSISSTGSITTTAASGTPITLVSGNKFINGRAGADALKTGYGGRWLVYSQNPSLDIRGDLVYDFKQYGTGYGGSIQGTGNGFIYSDQAVLNFALSGNSSKTYDGSTAATLTSAANNYVVTGGTLAAEDTITSITGAYNSEHTDATSVSVGGSSVVSVNAGGKPVYGYRECRKRKRDDKQGGYQSNSERRQNIQRHGSVKRRYILYRHQRRDAQLLLRHGQIHPRR
jgi:hypothetical protein